MKSKTEAATKNITFAFDIGHSSIGWSALSVGTDYNPATLRVLGAGTVLFQKDSCLASSRRGFRRARRNIAARRARIAALSAYLLSLGVLTKEQLAANTTSAPWLLAARVLASDGKKLLSWPELWAVIRWYAHNRGYDGNALWAGDDALGEPGDEPDSAELKEDAQKVKNAQALLEKFHTTTMAETVCAFLEVEPLGSKSSSTKRFKGENAAFPRPIVENEVRRILNAHLGKLTGLDDSVLRALLVRAPAARRRFVGGLLFGQAVPRFNNRIIPKCRISGKNTPNKSSRAFLLYRWGRLLNNLTVRDPATDSGRPLDPDERKKLHDIMLAEGFFTKTSLNAAIRQVTACEPFNTESYFMTEEMEEALVLDPVKKAIASNTILKAIWPALPEAVRDLACSRLQAQKAVSAAALFAAMERAGHSSAPAKAALKAAKVKGKTPPEHRSIHASFPSGRAAYASPVLLHAFEQCLAGIDPVSEKGCLYETPEIRARLLAQADNVDHLTNNHLVRHRLKIFRRLLAQMVGEFANGDPKRVAHVVVEVVRDLQAFSGLNSKEMAQALSQKLGNFRQVAATLEKEAAAAGVPVTGSLIRKARLLVDQQFKCPYTGATIGWNHLLDGQLEIEHIIPRSLRPSDALSSCVLTFRSVNDMKGQRTAAQFIKDCQSQPVPGADNLSIWTWKAFQDNAEKISRPDRAYRPFDDDRKRCRRRSELLLVERYDPRDGDFTDRDLTQTSHLNKLAIQIVLHDLGIAAVHVPGSVTGFLRPRLSIDSCLFQAVPRIQAAAQLRRQKAAERLGIRLGEGDLPEEAEEKLTAAARITKQEVRDLSHLHHAMDAVTQALAFLLFDPADWKLLVKRHIPASSRSYLLQKYPALSFSRQDDLDIKPLPAPVLASVADALRENRVVQHVPSRMHGMVVDQTTWRIVDDSDPKKIKLDQQTRDARTGKPARKPAEAKQSLILGGPAAPADSKLRQIKGAVQISENWGLALDPAPTIIPFFKVFPRIRDLRQQNGNRPVRIIRRGDLIRVSNGNFKGIWKVLSIKDNSSGLALDLNIPDKVAVENRTADTKINVRLASLISSGITILKPTLTGSCPTT